MIKLILLLFAIAACSTGQKDSFFDFKSPLGESIDVASLKILKEAFAAAYDQNLVISTLGIQLLLSMYSACAGESVGVREEIVKALGSSNYDNLFQSYSRLSDRFSSMDPRYLIHANKLYVDQRYEVADELSTGAVSSYHSNFEKIDFNDRRGRSAAAAMNRWYKEKTKGFLENPAFVEPYVAAALLDVTSLQGHWNFPFNSSETEVKTFYVDKSYEVRTPMMHLTQPLYYYESTKLGAKMIEIPFKETNFRMVVILPDEIDGLPVLIEKIQQKGIFSDLFTLESVNGDIYFEMPKIKIEIGAVHVDLNHLLTKVGVSKIYTDPVTKIIKGGAVVTDAYQQAFLEVDEEGLKFTGFLMAQMTSFSKPPNIQRMENKVELPSSAFQKPRSELKFIANHPFLFEILHEDIVIFAGTYTHS